MSEADRAVVIGASVAGLLAAHALSGHLAEVVLSRHNRRLVWGW
jgi:predicted flavoprotein YhiN